MANRIYYVVFVGLCVTVLKEVNTIVTEPYMDEPFHIHQAQAYCRSEFDTWDPKLTTPPGLYIMSLLLKRVFMFKCNIPMLRLTACLNLIALPIVLTRLLCFHKRIRPPSLLEPLPEAIVLSLFPIVWFFGFLYYTEVPSVLFVVWTAVAASEDEHWKAALLGLISCTFRQTNIIWMLYAYASSQLMYLRFRRSRVDQPAAKLHDPPALVAGPLDFLRSFQTFPKVLADLIPPFMPYLSVLCLFGLFVVWNGGIVLGDKSNHIPTVHIPQLYYFVAFCTAFGWPVLISGNGGVKALSRNVWYRMFGSYLRTMVSMLMICAMAFTVKHFTIHHPFLLSDNRHYTFYIWRRIYMIPRVPFLLVPVYIACAWAWYLRVGQEQTMLQTIVLPILASLSLLPTPLLEPRYFLIPYILLRMQVADVPNWALVLEGIWYCAINFVTMGVFLYLPREGVGRFMW